MPKYLVVHPKLALRVSIDGGEEKLQNVPVGTEVTLEKAIAEKHVKSGKLKLVNAKKASQKKSGDAKADTQADTPADDAGFDDQQK